MATSIVLTVIGQDQLGIVEAVSDVLARHGGNWTQSSMSALAGQFAGILLATVPDDRVRACLEGLESLRDKGLTVIARTTSPATAKAETREFLLDLVGHDHAGIVRDITQVLARHGVSVHDLETRVESASMAGGELFRAEARLEVPTSTDIARLEQDLEAIATELMVELHLQD